MGGGESSTRASLGYPFQVQQHCTCTNTGQTAAAVFPHEEPCFSPGSVHLTQMVVLWAEMSSPACLDCDEESSIAAGQLAPSSL